MSRHTAGPWSQDRWGDIIAGGEKLLVSGVSLPCGNHPQAHEAKANARLIAAAPELLDFAARVEARISALAYSGASLDNDMQTMLAEAREAIAKATQP